MITTNMNDLAQYPIVKENLFSNPLFRFRTIAVYSCVQRTVSLVFDFISRNQVTLYKLRIKLGLVLYKSQHLVKAKCFHQLRHWESQQIDSLANMWAEEIKY